MSTLARHDVLGVAAARTRNPKGEAACLDN
jgi:hypothetical protein